MKEEHTNCDLAQKLIEIDIEFLFEDVTRSNSSFSIRILTNSLSYFNVYSKTILICSPCFSLEFSFLPHTRVFSDCTDTSLPFPPLSVFLLLCLLY